MRSARLALPAGLLAVVACTSTTPDDAPPEGPHGRVQSAISSAEILGSSLADKQLALTFDDGPGDRTIELSAWLRARGIRATFFINGANVPGREHVLGGVTADGHLLATHTQTHASLTSLSSSQILSEISQTDTLLTPHVPQDRLLFRAPYFDWSASVYSTVNGSSMKKYVGPIGADIGTELTPTAAADWACWDGSYTTQACGDLYLQEIETRRRGIVLMHDPFGGTSGNTVDMVKYVVPILEARGYTFRRADEVPAIAALFPQPPPPPPPPAAGITIGRGESVGGYVSDVYRWKDASGRDRSAALVRNDVQDPMGFWGGYLRRFTYVKAGGTTVTSTGHSYDWPGWGYTVNHQSADDSAVSSRFQPGTYRTVFAGAHHAVHEYRWTIPFIGGNVVATVQWVFSTGRDHPLWAGTFDCSGAAPNAVSADDRSPAGLLNFDGDVDSDVSGVGWGDRYKFKTTSTPESMSSSWTYNTTNTVPYVWEWSNATDTEMGAVQTQSWSKRDAGYGWFHSNWGRTSTNKVITEGTPSSPRMPLEWNWTYQLNQWELPWDNTNKRMAWGMNYGAVGQTSYPAYGDDRTLSGYPYQSHSVTMVLGAKRSNVVAIQVTQVERSILSSLTATRGTVRTSGPGGVGRSDAVTFSPAGWNSVYGTWEVTANASSGVTMRLDTKARAVDRPMFRIGGYRTTVPATIIVGGATWQNDVDYFASVDTATQTMWLTLARTLNGAVTIVIN